MLENLNGATVKSYLQRCFDNPGRAWKTETSLFAPAYEIHYELVSWQFSVLSEPE
jgi:hypothetical protein